MGEAIVRGLLSSGWAQAEEILVVEALPARREELSEQYPGLHVGENLELGIDVLLAVKPQDVAAALSAGNSREGAGIPSGGTAQARTNAFIEGDSREGARVPSEVSDSDSKRVQSDLVSEGEQSSVASSARFPRLLSIAAGVRIEVLQSLLGRECRVLRAMPNTPALLGAGMAALAAGPGATEDDLVWAKGILSAVGKVVVVEEELLDAVTGVSGSGPAYLFLVAEAMIAAGVEAGLEPEVADMLIRQTLLGSAMLLAEGEDTPEQLRVNVTSPGGTTAEALQVFEDAGLRDIFREAILAATERSKELGG